MFQDNSIKNTKETNLFVGKKTKASKKAPSKKNKTKTPVKEQTEDTSMVSTRDFFSAMSDYTTFEEVNDYPPLYHESLFGLSIFGNEQNNLELEGKGLINDTYFNHYDHSMFSLPHEKGSEEETTSKQGDDIDCQIINFPAITEDDYEDLNNALMSSYPTSLDILAQNKPQKDSSSIKFVVTRKGRKKNSTSHSINKKLPPPLKCGHENCSNSFYTVKQKAIHHKKLSPLCTNDTITLIKMIGNIKTVLHDAYHYQKGRTSPLESIKQKYDAFIQSFAFKDYFQYIVGKKCEDCIAVNEESEGEKERDTLI